MYVYGEKTTATVCYTQVEVIIVIGARVYSAHTAELTRQDTADIALLYYTVLCRCIVGAKHSTQCEFIGRTDHCLDRLIGPQ